MAIGEEWYAWMTLLYQYTGQRKEESIGLCDYNTRFYDSYITQFTQPDSIIPDPYNVLDWNRYSYVQYNPVKYSDPSGHIPIDELLDLAFIVYDAIMIIIEGPTPTNEWALTADVVCLMVPYVPGGGVGARLGNEAVNKGVTRLPMVVRGLQVTGKFVQFAEANSDNLDGLGSISGGN